MLQPIVAEKPKQTIVQAAAQAYLLKHRQKLAAFIDPAKLADRLANLCEDQEDRLRDDDPTSPIPLLWIALAECAGLTINIADGRIIDGPKEQLAPLEIFPVTHKKTAGARPLTKRCI